MILRILSNLLAGDTVTSFRRTVGKSQMFDKIVGYEGIKRTFLRSLNSPEPVHILRFMGATTESEHKILPANQAAEATLNV